MSARDRIARALRRLFCRAGGARPNPLPAHVTRHAWTANDKRRLGLHIAAASAPARKSKRRSR